MKKKDTFLQAIELAGQLPGLLLDVEKVAPSFMRGTHGRRRVGAGESFWQFRPYAAGDSVRHIDWKQTAKREEAFVRETEWEAAQTLWLYRDGTESMNFSSTSKLPTKKDYAEVLLMALGIVALDAGEQAGLLGIDMAPQAHRGAAERLYSMLPAQEKLMEGPRRISARSHIALFSDFYESPESLFSFCEPLARREVQGVFIQICDPAEENLPYRGRVKFSDVEEGGAAPILISQVESIRDAYRENFLAHREMIKNTIESWGWSFLSFTTDVSYQQSFPEVYNLCSPSAP